jgi:DNA-binding transcriptional ArsR family regulator
MASAVARPPNARMTQRSGAPEERLDGIFGALADRTRRAMLARLRDGPATVSELAAPFAMSLPAVSRHLRVLERERLVVRDVEGRVHRCSLGTAPLREVERWLERYRSREPQAERPPG